MLLKRAAFFNAIPTRDGGLLASGMLARDFISGFVARIDVQSIPSSSPVDADRAREMDLSSLAVPTRNHRD